MEFKEEQQRAWEILKPQERMALSLIIVNERSQREASLIMGISHYKFLEIYLRARRLFEIFINFLEKDGDIYDSSLLIEEKEHDIIRRLLFSRKTFNKLIYEDEDLLFLFKKSDKDNFWEKVFFSLKTSKSDKAKLILDTLIEYDKWNNFRILPRAYQKISPFPRRRNREFKKIKASVEGISELVWYILERNFKSIGDRPKAYIPKLFYKEDPTSLEVQLTPKSFRYFTKNKIPLFSTEKEAIHFSGIIFFYNNLSQKSSFAAKKFWAQFREALVSSLNYNELLGIKTGELMELSIKDREFIKKAVKQQKPKRLKRIKPSDDRLFY